MRNIKTGLATLTLLSALAHPVLAEDNTVQNVIPTAPQYIAYNNMPYAMDPNYGYAQNYYNNYYPAANYNAQYGAQYVVVAAPAPMQQTYGYNYLPYYYAY
ncbi:MAG: hypothetical protein P8P30_09075 [Rickettsiales bacterium]|nr:hypothetical protein [Rickettsiales bacterium]